MGAKLSKIAERPEAWRRFLIHALGVLVLMWPAVLNRQPFFFPDTTSYVRAADLAVRLGTHQRVQSAWSNNDPAPSETAAASGGAPAPQVAHGSDGRGGNAVMAGRSPYFGALLYVSWVSSSFWLFVIAQAIVGWWLIGMALRCFGIACARTRLVLASVLSLLTPLAFYTGLLLADDLAGLGLLAFVILAAEPSDLRPVERWGLIAVLLLSVVSHLTHIVMTLAMTAVLLLYLLTKRRPWQALRRPVIIGGVATVIGLASVTLTGIVITHALGRPPAMAPLMTARFIIDGPGRDYIAGGCGGRSFAACRIASNARSSDLWLWSWEPGEGGYLTQDSPTRTALSDQDKAFAIEVLKAYPLRQGGMMLWNTVKQLGDIESSVLNAHCIADAECSHIVLPPSVRGRMQQSMSGRDAWPVGLIDGIHFLALGITLGVLALFLPKLLRDQPEAGRRLLLWLVLIGVAMLANAFLGGAISSPQGRYQARIAWLLPLLALLAWERLRGGRLPAPAGSR